SDVCSSDLPPFFASAIAMLLSETDCMIAEEKGIFNINSGSSPLLNLQIGVFKSTFSTTQSFVVKFGKSKNSPKVLDGSLIIFAILYLLFVRIIILDRLSQQNNNVNPSKIV